MTVQRLHDADAGQLRRATAFRNKDQRLDCGLPFRRVVSGLLQLHDGARGVRVRRRRLIRARYRILRGGGEGRRYIDERRTVRISKRRSLFYRPKARRHLMIG